MDNPSKSCFQSDATTYQLVGQRDDSMQEFLDRDLKVRNVVIQINLDYQFMIDMSKKGSLAKFKEKMLKSLVSVAQRQLALALTSKKAFQFLDCDQTLMFQVHGQRRKEASLLHGSWPKSVVFVVLVHGNELCQIADMSLYIRKVDASLGTKGRY